MEDKILPFLHCSLDIFGLSNIPGLEVGGYVDSMLNSVPLAYYGAILVSFGAVILAYIWTNSKLKNNVEDDDKVGNQTLDNEVEVCDDNLESLANSDSFEISPLDECEFVPLVSHEEDQRIAAELAPKTKYIPLDADNPTAHVNAYLDMVHDDSEEYSDDDEAVIKARNFTTDDLSKYISEKDLHILDDPRESPSRRGTVMSRVKKARQRALRRTVEKDMSAEDRLREQMAANQMLARVYTVMRENKEMFGDTSFEDVKSQMDLYKA